MRPAPSRSGDPAPAPAVSDDPVRRADGVWTNGVQDRAVLYSAPLNKALVLNPAGAVLWDALETPRRPSELARVLRARFPDLTAERAEADTSAFLDRLLREGVLQRDA